MNAVIILINPFPIHVFVKVILQLDTLERGPVGLDDFMITLTGRQRHHQHSAA